MGLAKRIIPCLDVDCGRVVKGVKFVEIRDAGDPVEIARRYDQEGADEITFLDITASSDDRETMVHVVERVASEVFIPLTVGGGVRTLDDVRRMLNAGADKVSSSWRSAMPAIRWKSPAATIRKGLTKSLFWTLLPVPMIGKPWFMWSNGWPARCLFH